MIDTNATEPSSILVSVTHHAVQPNVEVVQLEHVLIIKFHKEASETRFGSEANDVIPGDQHLEETLELFMALFVKYHKHL